MLSLSLSLSRRGGKNRIKTAVCHKPKRERRRKRRLFSQFSAQSNTQPPANGIKAANEYHQHRNNLNEKAYCHTKRYA
ncbi:hypothetical protein DMO60_04210 [Salmonella enterica subsp. enterica]|nr:hypothetical protein [Salmonella enterica subsp. enterica serovar Java]